MSLITWNKAILMAGLLAATLSAQNPICGDTDTGPSCNLFDATGNEMLNGTYFVREIQLAGVNTTGTSVNTAYSLLGTMTFDGAGNYSFTGQKLDSTVTTGVASYTTTGGYAVSANGMLVIQDLVFSATSAASLGAVGAAGPGAFVASHPGANPVLMVGIPVGGTALSGAYYGSYFDFNQANVTTIREAWFPFNSDGSGNLGTLSVTGSGTDLGGTIQTQQLPGVTYSFAGNAGTMNFGGASASNFISGSQTFYVSTDGSLILGGTPGDFDVLVGIKALAGSASNASLSGIYVLGGFENDASVPGWNILHAFNGSTSATGSGTSITHRQLVRTDTVTPAFRDYTTAATYTIPESGVFTPNDGYQYAVGANGQTFLATGQAGLQSVMLGLKAPAFSGTGVWLNPIGIVNAANSAPFTNPVAPNELVTLYGSGMAPSGLVYAPSLPLPTILNGVQVYVNGSPAPLFAVSPTLIQVLSPSRWSPNNGWGYVTFQICLGDSQACNGGTGTYSNAVRVLAQNSAPGVFNLTGSATGPGAVRHALDNTLVDSSHPAHPGEIVAIYATGLGITANQPADGSAGLYSPLSHAWRAYMGGVQCDPLQGSNYAGLAPGFAGLYQINVTVPSGTGFGDVPLEIWLTEGQTIETTINIEAVAGASVK
ncbi:MAG: hypothetical protein ABSH47_09010 [Bryobacteraceae bacterium]|jgi:uncharacterized protein (TIGR03437 family)